MTTTIHPFFIVAAIGLIVTLALGILCFRTSSVVRRAFLILFALIFALPAAWVIVLLRPELVDSRFRTYKAFYRDIHEGMTRPDIDALLARHYPPTGPRQRPKIMDDTSARLDFFMSPETSREPNCEGIFLTLHDGRITKKTYSPD